MSNMMVQFLQQQAQTARQILEGTLADVSNEDAHRQPGGLANPIGAQYAHVLTGEDAVVNATLKGGAPLFAGEYAGKTGLSALPPAEEGSGDWHEWASSVRVDMEQLRRYGQAVHAASDAFLSGLSDADLSRSAQTPLGEMALGGFLSVLLVANYFLHCGEIACIKGIHGKRGYPF